MLNVSVVLPVFNGARTIARAVGSILDQTLRELELIDVDDGSTDDTAEIIRQLRDSRVKLFRRPHQGVAIAANSATHHAAAPFIARMDADDFAHPRRLERQLEFLQAGELDVVGCQVRIVNESGNKSETLDRYERWINEETLTGEQINAFRFVGVSIGESDDSGPSPLLRAGIPYWRFPGRL